MCTQPNKDDCGLVLRCRPVAEADASSQPKLSKHHCIISPQSACAHIDRRPFSVFACVYTGEQAINTVSDMGHNG